jgi:hypothetical protein
MSTVSVTDRAADRAAEAFALVGTWLSSDAMTELLSDGLVAEVVAAKPADAGQSGPASWLPSDEKLPDWVIAGTERAGVTPVQIETLRRALAA